MLMSSWNQRCFMQNREKATFYTCLNSFEGEIFRKLVKNTIAVDKTFVDLACFCRAKDTMPTNFAEKTFANTRNSQKFSPLKVSHYTVNSHVLWFISTPSTKSNKMYFKNVLKILAWHN